MHRHCFLDVLKFASLSCKKWIVFICRIYLLRVSFWFQHGGSLFGLCLVAVASDCGSLWRFMALKINSWEIATPTITPILSCSLLFVMVGPYKINCTSARNKWGTAGRWRSVSNVPLKDCFLYNTVALFWQALPLWQDAWHHSHDFYQGVKRHQYRQKIWALLPSYFAKLWYLCEQASRQPCAVYTVWNMLSELLK